MHQMSGTEPPDDDEFVPELRDCRNCCCQTLIGKPCVHCGAPSHDGRQGPGNHPLRIALWSLVLLLPLLLWALGVLN